MFVSTGFSSKFLFSISNILFSDLKEDSGSMVDLYSGML
jgi:hypothetical protein